MSSSLFLAFFIISLFIVVIKLPAYVLQLVVRFKARFRQYLVQKYGRRAFEALHAELRHSAAAHQLPFEVIELLLKQKRNEIIAIQGNAVADAVLGERKWYE